MPLGPANSRHYPEADASRAALSRAIYAARCVGKVTRTELIQRHNAKAGVLASKACRAGVAV